MPGIPPCCAELGAAVYTRTYYPDCPSSPVVKTNNLRSISITVISLMGLRVFLPVSSFLKGICHEVLNCFLWFSRAHLPAEAVCYEGRTLLTATVWMFAVVVWHVELCLSHFFSSCPHSVLSPPTLLTGTPRRWLDRVLRNASTPSLARPSPCGHSSRPSLSAMSCSSSLHTLFSCLPPYSCTKESTL